jgi:tRNA(Ile)-lysidine synthase
LHDETLAFLRSRKNLLAYSGGGDSTALFFLLQEAGIPFDIALVNYKTRDQSDAEEAYAKTLATRFNKNYFIFTCQLSTSNFEHYARQTRYRFFETLATFYGYETLITAHHLGDRLEWFLMQLSKGAGLVEMLGMKEREERDSFTLVRPLLHLSKEALKNVVNTHNIAYFEDESNDDKTLLRNRFRHDFATPLLEEFAQGIANSFDYLDEDAKRLLPSSTIRTKDLFLLRQSDDDLLNIRQIDKAVKSLGKLLSHKEREEILRTKDCVVAGKIAVVFDETSIWVAPFLHMVMPKHFKEACRKERIPNKIRPYLFTCGLHPSQLRLDRTL